MQVAGPILNTAPDLHLFPDSHSHPHPHPPHPRTVPPAHAINQKYFATSPSPMSRSPRSSAHPDTTPTQRMSQNANASSAPTAPVPTQEGPRTPGPAAKRRPKPCFDLAGDLEDEEESGTETGPGEDGEMRDEKKERQRARYNGGNATGGNDSGGEDEHDEEDGDLEDTPRPSMSRTQQQEQEQERLSSYAFKRWNALMEIVQTEAGYVHDLRALVNVYFAVLPTLPLSEQALQAVNALAQSGMELLKLHERFWGLLQEASKGMESMGGECGDGEVEEAVRRVAGLFADEAANFDLYQEFCSTQPDALRLLRPMQSRQEWETFEHICARLHYSTSPPSTSQSTSDASSSSSSSKPLTSSPSSSSLSPTPPPPTSMTSHRRVPRTLSLVPTSFRVYGPASFFTEPCLPSPVTPVSPTTEFLNAHPGIRSQSYDSGLARVVGSRPTSPNGHRRGAGSSEGFVHGNAAEPPSPTPGGGGQRTRLRFQDYLIKPIQRICKYPLMLEGLKRRDSVVGIGTTGGEVERAVESMKAVAARVDEARRRKEAEEKTRMILERLDGHSLISPDFLQSLGTCILAGSLDVVHHHHILEPITPTVRVRYFGAFLFAGGYVLLVKVAKGPVYRLKHWFALASFEVVDISPNKAIVPHSFRLSCVDHHYELAAASAAEKSLWLNTMKSSLAQPASWISEPVPSFHVARPSTPNSPSLADLKLEPLTPLSPPPSSRSSSSSRLSLRGLGSGRRRSSVTSNPSQRLFSMPSPSEGAGPAPSVLLRRCSRTDRDLVERDLGDVQTDVITSLRAHAAAKEEVLFPGVKYPVGGHGGPHGNAQAGSKLLRRGSSQSQSGSGSGCGNGSDDAHHGHANGAYIPAVNGNGSGHGHGYGQTSPAKSANGTSNGAANSLRRALSNASSRGRLVRPRPLLMLATSNSTSTHNSESTHEEIPEGAVGDEEGQIGGEGLKRTKSLAGSLREFSGFVKRKATMRRSSGIVDAGADLEGVFNTTSDEEYVTVIKEHADSNSSKSTLSALSPPSSPPPPRSPSPSNARVTFASSTGTSPRSASRSASKLSLGLGTLYEHEKRRSISAAESMANGGGVSAVAVDASTRINRRRSLKAMLFT